MTARHVIAGVLLGLAAGVATHYLVTAIADGRVW